MRILSIDLETFSDIDLITCGAYKYASSDNFEILLMAYAFDDEPVNIIDIACGEKIPDEIILALQDGRITKSAYNASFERIMLSKHLGTYLSAKSWECTAVKAATLSLPASLANVASVLKLEQGKDGNIQPLRKLDAGKELIRYFCVPCSPTQGNGGRCRNLPCHALEKWELFKTYCIRDVEVERNIRNKLSKFKFNEQVLYELDQQINDTGVLVDVELVKNAIAFDALSKADDLSQAKALTGLDNPNSVAQLKQWLSENGLEVDSLLNKMVQELAKENDGDIQELLNLRLRMSKTSTKKYEAIKRSVCNDGRVRGLLQFYGANRTGRWAGRLVQVQNLPQNHIKDLELARQIVKSGDFKLLEQMYDSVPAVLSELIRTAFIPQKGSRFIVADFSAIEARVIAWLAGEQWRIDVFNSHGKIYEASASAMFHVPIEQIDKGSQLRQKGKISELALGYGGSVGALTAMGALSMGVYENELLGLVNAWRKANPAIVKFWWDIGHAAELAVTKGKATAVGRIKIGYAKVGDDGYLMFILPSGRRLCYFHPSMQMGKFDRLSVTYEGIQSTKKWGRVDSYGPKFVENIVQAVARDLLAEAMLRLNKFNYRIVMHCHDESVAEMPIGTGSFEEMCDIMAVNPLWADGLPLKADGYECEFYKKE
jgi:DNA polymerase